LYKKLVSAIDSAVEALENSTEAAVKNGGRQLEKLVWKVSAELEYALFLFSIMHSGELKPPKKVNPKSKSLEIDSTLASVQDLLREVKENLGRKEMAEAYQKAWVAREHLLKVHGEIEKQRKQEKRK